MSLLDLSALVSDDKTVERHTLAVFEGILKTCHDLIKRYNKEQVKQMFYSVPGYVFGKPMYDVNVLTNYLMHHLTDNGLYVQQTQNQRELFISWDDKYINIDRFIHRKEQLKINHGNLIMGMAARPLSNIEAMRLRQERQRQISFERQERFKKQK